MNITCFKDLADEAARMERKAVIAVIEAHDENTLESLIEARRDGIMTPLLIGNGARIRELLTKLGANPGDYETIESGGVEESLKTAVGLINEGRATAVMKGMLDSADFMRTILSKENGLMRSDYLSLIGLYETASYHKLLAVSDVALNTYPDLRGKRAILENGVALLNTLGIENPKVAVLAAVEKVNLKMPETLDADALKKMNQNGGIKNCVVEGPIAFDLATSAEAARIKGYDSPVAGDADLLIVPDIAVGNILAKCLTGMAGARTAGTVLGARIPVILTSRSAEATDKYYSIALAACAAGTSFLGRADTTA